MEQLQPQGHSLNAQELAIMRKKKRLEQRKQKRLVRKEKLLEKKRILLQDYLAREIKYGQYTLRKYQTEWEKMLKSIALPRQMEEIELALQSFERLVDIKDYIISCLMDKLRQSEDYYVMCLNMHISQVDKIITRFQATVEEIHNKYDMQIESLREEEEGFIMGMEETTKSNMTYLKAMVYGLEMKNKTDGINIRADYCAKDEFETIRYEFILLQPGIKFDKMVRYIWDAMNEVFRTYKMKTHARQKKYELIKVNNDKLEELLAKAMNRINNLNRIIKLLKRKEDSIKENKLVDLNSNLKLFHETYMLLKQNLTADLKIDKHQLKLLVWEFNDTYSQMDKMLNQGQHLVRFLQCCKRLETSDELVRPYPIFIKQKEAEEQDPLYLFWQKIAKVRAMRYALLEEKGVLTLKNKGLRKDIEGLCVCVSCPKLPPICNKEGPVPFTDGTTMMRKYDLRNRSRKR